MFISLDLETTGFDPKKDKIIEFGAIKFDLQGNSETFQFLCNPGIQIPDIVTHITNIRNSDLENEGPFSEKVSEVQEFIGDLPIIGHNIQFDTGFLRENGVTIPNLEYDTHDLAAMLLPGMQSYSLEILSKVFSLEHKEKHRALDDAIAAMELFLILTKKFQTLNPELIQTCQELLKRSNWPLKNHLLELKKTEGDQINQSKVDENNLPSISYHKEIEQMDDKSIIQFSPPYQETIENLLPNCPDECYISIPNELFYKIEEQLPNDIAKIDCYDHYLSVKKLEKFCKRDQFTNEEISALLKIIIWAEQTKTGLLREVRLKGEELKIFSHIAVSPDDPEINKEEFIKKALEKDKDAAAVCTHSYLIEHPPENCELIIFDFQNLHDRLHRRRATFLTLEICSRSLLALRDTNPETPILNVLLEKLETLYALIDNIFEKYNDKNMYAPRCIVNEQVLSVSEWRNCQEVIKALIENSTELAELKKVENLTHLRKWKEVLHKLNSVFNKSDFSNNFIFVEKDWKENILVREVPLSITSELQEILDKNHKYKIIDQSFLHIPENTTTKNSTNKSENIEIIVVPNIDEKKKFQKIDFIEQNSKAEKKAIILNSKKELEFYTLELQKRGFNTVSQLTASTGKLGALYENTENPLLLVTPNMWNKLGCIHDIEEVFIAKIPFEPPSDAFLIAQSKKYNNPFEQLTIPRSIVSLKRSINRLALPSDKTRTIFFLDPRLTEKSYGKKIIENLKESYLVN